MVPIRAILSEISIGLASLGLHKEARKILVPKVAPTQAQYDVNSVLVYMMSGRHTDKMVTENGGKMHNEVTSNLTYFPPYRLQWCPISENSALRLSRRKDRLLTSRGALFRLPLTTYLILTIVKSNGKSEHWTKSKEARRVLCLSVFHSQWVTPTSMKLTTSRLNPLWFKMLRSSPDMTFIEKSSTVPNTL